MDAAQMDDTAGGRGLEDLPEPVKAI